MRMWLSAKVSRGKWECASSFSRRLKAFLILNSSWCIADIPPNGHGTIEWTFSGTDKDVFKTGKKFSVRGVSVIGNADVDIPQPRFLRCGYDHAAGGGVTAPAGCKVATGPSGAICWFPPLPMNFAKDGPPTCGNSASEVWKGSVMTTKATTDARDSAQLEALGANSNFDRSMSLWSNFAMGFAYSR